MILSIDGVLAPAGVAQARAVLTHAAFEDGRVTAGWAAAGVKRNAQARSGARGGEAVAALAADIVRAVEANAVFALAVRPKALSPLILSRYRPGDAYGTHVDDALMGLAGSTLRTDVSFTLFLSDPDTYEGGALVLETPAGEEHYRLHAGALLVYPSTRLHRVEPVISGERLAAVGWGQSVVRDEGKREILFDLDTARRLIFEREGKTREFDLLSKTTANLLRMWAEV